jgi:hypothetical protein
MKRILLALGTFASLVLTSAQVKADEGMWTFDNLPKSEIRSRYGFNASNRWIKRVMRSSVRLNVGGSGSFVSRDGLVLTNHHVAADTLQKLSTAQRDLYRTGFLAHSFAEEIKAPDLEINQLLNIQDVTTEVNSVVTAGMSASDALTARRAKMAQIEQREFNRTQLRSDVVTLYNGGQYHLYQYKKYTDVRLVFAPEFDIAFFGGDPDNFEFPRYNLDMTLFRVYENDRPARLDNFLRWSTRGAQADELVFVSGNPGRTERMLTVPGLEFLRDRSLPFLISQLARRESVLAQYAALGGEQARQAQDEFFSIQNSLKVRRGQLSGLASNPAILNGKRQAEAQLQAAARGRSELSNEVGAWNMLEQAHVAHASVYVQRSLLETGAGFQSRLFRVARVLVRMAAEDAKPEAQRLPEFRPSAREALMRDLLSAAPIYPALDQFKLADSLSYLQSELGAQHPAVLAALAGRTPAERAREVVAGTTLTTVAGRQAFVGATSATLAASADTMIQLAIAVDAAARQVRSQYEAQVEGPTIRGNEMLAKIMFAINGTSQYPDATFTPRLSFGKVMGYTEPNGTAVNYFTTMSGAFAHQRTHGSTYPYALPQSWRQAESRLNPNTHFNFVSTNDIIGGNSGSPVINRRAELVGLIFDGNIHSLVGSFVYDQTRNRAVSVDSAGMLEALNKVYGAGPLIRELVR